MPETDSKDSQNSRWPLSNMMLNGTFKTGSAAERRVARSSWGLLITLLVWTAIVRVAHLGPSPKVGIVTLFLCVSWISYYAWAKRKYFLSLDELTRRIELEGMAWAYSLGVLGAVWGGAIAYAISLERPFAPRLISGTEFFLFAIFLATVKGAYRYFATRKY